MKILLTGQPKVGKTTVIQNFRKIYKGIMTGIICHAIWDDEGHRDGFEVENFEGERKLFAHKSLIQSEFIIKNKFHVDIDVIDNFFVPEMQKSEADPESLVIIDEIGRMEAFSPLFFTNCF